MKFEVSHADWGKPEESIIEINTLEELIEFTKNCCEQQSIVLHIKTERFEDRNQKYPSIIIYDDYLE